MKVLQINAVNGIRSTGRATTEIAEYLNGNGHKSYIAYSDGPPYYRGFQIGTTIEKKAHALLSRIFGKQAYYSKYGTYKLLEYMDQIRPDVVHLGNLHSNYINLEMLLDYLAINDIPTVLTLHDCWFYTGKCTHYSVDKCGKWQDKCGVCPRLKKDNKSWFFDRTSKMLQDKKEWFSRIPRLAVVGVSDWITNEARKSILSSSRVITRIYNWIDLAQFRPVVYESKKRELGIDGKFIILGVASGWSDAKGLSGFMELAKKINNDEVIVIVGNIEKDIELSNNIIHINETHDIDELVTIYSMADVLLNLSLEESFGKVTAEALACGTPVITNNSTANPELIGESCGYIVGGKSLNEITEKIKKIKKDSKMYYSGNCIRFATDNFGKNERIKDYLGLYHSIIDIKGE